MTKTTYFYILHSFTHRWWENHETYFTFFGVGSRRSSWWL